MVVFCDKYFGTASIHDRFDCYDRLYLIKETLVRCTGRCDQSDRWISVLTVGSSGLVSNFRPVLVGLKDVFKIDAMVIDPYFGQNAVTAGVEEVFGKGFGDAMILLLIAFIVNILLVRFSKFTKLRALFTTGHVQVQQAATAYWQAEKLFGKKKDGKEVKKIDDVELPGFMSIFNENMVCTSLCIIRRKNGSCSV